MAYDGSITFDTSLDASGLRKGTNELSNIVKGLGIFELLKKGIQLIADSIGDAMKRIDTMDQFNRVMTTMTGSTDKANKALQATNKIVSGTAFGLDTAAKGVQAFVASGMTVTRATDTMGAWADAVAFYTKGTNAELESVSNALQKMGTKGNVTMEHLQMLLEAGIPAIQIYADAMGISTEQVTESMQKGELSTKQFVNVMNEAFTTGTTGFPSVAGAAKEAGASWGGSIDNMKAAIARGTASFLLAFDNVFKVKDKIVGFGKTIEKVMKFVSENMTAVIPITVALSGALLALKVANTVSSAFNKLKSAISNGATAFKLIAEGAKGAEMATLGLSIAEKAVAAAIAAANFIKAAGVVIVTAFSGANVVATGTTVVLAAAVKALGAALYAALGPFGLILLAIVAVVAAVALVANAVKKANKEYYAEADALKELKKEHEEYAKKLEESKRAANEEAQEKLIQAQKNRDLLNSMAELVDANGVFKGSAEEAKAKVKELNQNVEGLKVAFNENTNSVNMNDEAFKKYGDSLVKVTEYQTAQDQYNNLLKEETDLQSKRNALEQKLEYYREKNKGGLFKVGLKEFEQNNKLILKSEKQLKEYDKTLGKLSGEVEFFGKKATEAYDAEAEAQVKAQEIRNTSMKQVKEYSGTYKISADQIVDEASRMEGGLEEWATKAEETYAHVVVAEKDFIEQIKAGNVEIDDSYAQSLEARRKNGEQLNATEQAYLEQWKAMNQQAVDLYKGQQKEIVDASKSKSEEIKLSEQKSAAEVIEIQRKNNEATSKFVDNYNTIWGKIPESQRQYLAGMTMEDARFLNDMVSKWDQGGSEQWAKYVGGLEKGAENSKKLAQGTAMDYGLSVVGGVGMGMESGIPVVNQSGTNLADSAGQGMLASTAPTDSANKLIADVSNVVGNGDFSGIPTAMANAISSGAGAVQNSVKSISTSFIGEIEAMKSKTINILTSMMTMMTGLFATQGSVLSLSAAGITNAVAAQFGQLTSLLRSIMVNAMLGMINAMNDHAPSLYSKADEIAKEVARRLEKGFDEHSPSKVTYKIFKNVILGGLNAMNDYSKDIYNATDELAEGVIKRMQAIPNNSIEMMASNMQGAIDGNRMIRSSFMPVSQSDTKSRGFNTTQNFTQIINSPKQLSASDHTREAKAMLDRARWQLP